MKRSLLVWVAVCPTSLAMMLSTTVHAAGSGGTVGQPGSRADWPCPGCMMFAPDGYKPDTPTPLIVALHGDEGNIDSVVSIWRGLCRAGGCLMLAPQCPVSEGCAGSWWRWAGDPAWLLRQVDAVEAEYNVELTAVYAEGWSGGGYYIGAAARQLVPRFAGFALVGGASPPTPMTCLDCKVPVYFLMGDQDHTLSDDIRTKDWFEGCGHEVVWDLQAGLDHMGGIGTLAPPAMKAVTITKWFYAHPNRCLGSPPPADAGLPPDAAAGPEAGSDMSAGGDKGASPDAGAGPDTGPSGTDVRMGGADAGAGGPDTTATADTASSGDAPTNGTDSSEERPGKSGTDAQAAGGNGADKGMGGCSCDVPGGGRRAPFGWIFLVAGLTSWRTRRRAGAMSRRAP